MVKLIIKLLEKTLNYLRKLENKRSVTSKLESNLETECIHLIKDTQVIDEHDKIDVICVKEVELSKSKKRKDIKKEKRLKLKLRLDSDNTKVKEIFKRQDVFIIGTGSSLIDFDFSLLKGKNTIAINKSFERVIDPSVLYWTDRNIYDWYKKEIDNLDCIKITASPHEKYTPDITVLKKINSISQFEKSRNKKDCIITCNSSGFAAVDLAIRLGAKRIFLLGYDMHNTNGKKHFHSGYPKRKERSKLDVTYHDMIEPFNKHGKDFLKYAQIYNTNPESALKTYEFYPLEKALQ